MRRVVRALTLGTVVVLLAAPAALAAIAVTRAELNGGELRVEGQGAQAGATITVDGIAMGTAAADGRFSIRRTGFSSSTCVITVSDGACRHRRRSRAARRPAERRHRLHTVVPAGCSELPGRRVG
jgi:hypothetical protein